MNKSLRNRIFFRTLLALILVVGCNRLASRWLSETYVMSTVEYGIARILADCEGTAGAPAAFMGCSQQASNGHFFENLALTLTSCAHDGALTALPTAAICAQLLSQPAYLPWADVHFVDIAAIQRAEVMQGGVAWLIFRRLAPSPQTVVLVRQDDVQDFLTRLWRLRDWVLLYVVPLSMLGMVGLTWVMMAQLMKPVRDMEQGVARLSSSTLDQPLQLAHQYQEFAALVAAFDDLRGRLHASFMQSQRFAADASHELRTPLTILRGHIERAIDESPVGSSTQIHLRVIDDEITRMVNVTEKLLLLSRVDAEVVQLTLDPVDFSEFMDELVSDAQAMQTTLSISADIAPGITWHCDSQLVRQLVHNLLTNALNYNVPSGWVRLKLEASAGWLQLTVENPSQGFTPEHEAKAFERFYRGNASRTREIDGMGLGLSLCREIAHLHQGTLTLAAPRVNAAAGWGVVCATLRAPLQASVAERA